MTGQDGASSRKEPSEMWATLLGERDLRRSGEEDECCWV